MVCLGFEPGTGEWKAQTNPLSYGGPTNGSNGFVCFKTFVSKLLIILMYFKCYNLAGA